MTSTSDWGHRRWAGQDLDPLPYESRWALLLRFMWMNSLREDTLPKDGFVARFLNPVKAYEKAAEAILFPVDRRTYISEGTGVATIDNAWLSKRFRYCPICLEHGYHTELFQVQAICACPIHRVPLYDQCQCCQMPMSRSSRCHLLLNAYYCSHCMQPISGARPNMEAHLDFRACIDDIGKAMAPYGGWWRAVQTKQLQLYAQEGERRSASAKWEQNPHLVWLLACQDHSPPELVAIHRFSVSDVVTLNWTCKVDVRSPAYHTPGLAPTGNAVYHATLRMLSNWIVHEDGIPPDQFDAKVRSYCFGSSLNDSLRLQAFVALRCYIENRFTYSGENLLDTQRYARVRDSIILSSHYGDRTCRLEWRAMFLALYSYCYYCLAKLRREVRDKIWQYCPDYYLPIFRRSTLVNADLLRAIPIVHTGLGGDRARFDDFVRTHPSVQAAFEGNAVFLRVAGMPMWPWERQT